MKSQINSSWTGEREAVIKWFNQFVSLKRGLKGNLVTEYDVYLHGKIYGALGCDICTG